MCKDPAVGEYVGYSNQLCENPTNCKGLSTWFGGNCVVDCLPRNPCYFYNDRNGNPEHMNICAIDISTGDVLENPLICSNPSNCEGISTLQAQEFSWFPDKCEIECVPPVTEAPVGQCNAGCVLEEECATETMSKIIYIQFTKNNLFWTNISLK